MHLPPDDFWKLTPREIQACFEAHAQEEERANIRAGTIAASAYNSKRSKKTDPVLDWKNFFQPLRYKPTMGSPQAVAAKFDALVAFSRSRKKRNAKPR